MGCPLATGSPVPEIDGVYRLASREWPTRCPLGAVGEEETKKTQGQLVYTRELWGSHNRSAVSLETVLLDRSVVPSYMRRRANSTSAINASGGRKIAVLPI